MRRRLIKILISFSLIVFLLYLFANIKPFQKVVLNSFLKSFEKKQGIQLTFDDVSGNLFHYLSFKNVKIGDFAEVPELNIGYNLSHLIRKNRKIAIIHIKKPIIHIDKALESNLEGGGKSNIIMVDSLLVDSSKAYYKNFSLPFSLFMKISENRIEVKKFSLNYPGSDFLFSGNYGFDGQLDFSHKFSLNLIDFAPTKGRISSEGNLKGSVNNPLGSGNFSFSSDNIDEFSMLYELKDSNLYIKDINIIDKKVSFVGSLKFNIRKKTGDFSFLGTAANKKYKISGKLNKKAVFADFSGEDILAAMECTLSDTIDLNIKGKYKNSPLSINLKYIAKHIKGGISVPHIALNEDVTLESVTGNFDATVIDKTAEGEANFNIERIFFLNEEIGGFEVVSDFKEKKAILRTAGLIKGKGEFQIEKSIPFSFDFNMKNFNLDAFLPEGKSKADFSGEITGLLAKPKDIKMSLYVENLESDFKGNSIRTLERIKVKYSYPKVIVVPSAISINDSKLSFSAEIPILRNNELKIDFSTQSFPLEILNPFVEAYDFKGIMDLAISVSGKTNKPEITANLKLENSFLFIEKDTLGPINIDAEAVRNDLKLVVLKAEAKGVILENVEPIYVKFTEDVIEIEPSTINLFDNNVSFYGTIPVPLTSEMDLNISTDKFLLKGLNPLIPGKIENGTLSFNIKIFKIKPFPYLSGKVHIDSLVLQNKNKNSVGPLSLNLALSGDTVRMERFDLFLKETQISNDGDLILNLNQNLIEVSQGRLKIGNNPFIFYGELPLDKESEFDIYCNCDSLDISIFSPLVPEGSLSGFISSDINLKGTRKTPQIYGDLVLRNNNFITKDMKIGPANGTFFFNGDIIDCPDITIGFPKGVSLISGNIGLNRNASLIVSFKETVVPIKKNSRLEVNGEIKLLSNPDIYSVEGELKVDGSYKDPFENELIIGIMKKANRSQGRTSDVAEKIKLNIGIGSNFVIDNREAYIKTESHLHVSGSPVKPGISGDTKIIEGGHLNYLGTKFNINEGTINFTDPTALKPELDLRASSEVFHDGINYLIFLHISGSPEKLRISVSSEPYMPVQEVLALLITGKTRKIEPISSAQGIGMKAVNHILNITKGRVEDRLASTLGVEKVTLDNSTSMKIGIEKQIGQKMRISYKTGFEDFRKPQLVIYYDLIHNLSVFSIYDRENRDVEAGFDIDLRK